MASPAGVEPATCPLGGGCAIQLCHGDVFERWGIISSLFREHQFSNGFIAVNCRPALLITVLF